ncbi:exo-beta-N-acetylmuramidase NamZ family protein [Paenibacillus sp. 481]|uniref:exo-beta-N-acetylmuramidase NamZ family protein n=1 Tax=Paenibacillus sp. 481 TaxID=2835869 RepID=UPI001E630852|nr:DUF1343 domain-containing protein [Paenibacillus sp. 481]UHA73971.1 DUF1343 domain-containing protein [Paenibacillus sp. 481]
MKLGLECLLEHSMSRLQGKRIGLVTNHTGVNARLVSVIDLFHERTELQLTALFSPEHGIRGDAKAGEDVRSSIDKHTGLPVYSLYGDTRKPTPKMLEQIELMVVDLQDIGTRYYTYTYTMANVMEACGELGIPIIVLDRPNPLNGLSIEGNIVELSCRSFVGQYPLPVRHGLTIGELAQLFCHEFGVRCELAVIQMEGWSRSDYFDQTGLLWVPPSPNATGLDMCLLYPGTCLLEGTNLSEGRGTSKPFEMIGAPFMDGYRLAAQLNERTMQGESAKREMNGAMSGAMDGVIARPVSFVPTYQKYAGQLCEGVQLHIHNRDRVHPFALGLYVLETLLRLYPEQIQFAEATHFQQLAGTSELQGILQRGEAERYLAGLDNELAQFRQMSAPYLLYR